MDGITTTTGKIVYLIAYIATTALVVIVVLVSLFYIGRFIVRFSRRAFRKSKA